MPSPPKVREDFCLLLKKPLSNESYLYPNMCLIKLLTSTPVAAVASFFPTLSPLKPAVQHFYPCHMYKENFRVGVKYLYNIASRAAQSNSIYVSVLKISIVHADNASKLFCQNFCGSSHCWCREKYYISHQ